MPEIVLICGDAEHVVSAISVNQYRAYTEIMERSEGKEDAVSAVVAGESALKVVFGITSREIRRAKVVDYFVAIKTIHFVMQEIITKKFLELCPDKPEVQTEKSAFDEYDEENGYNEAERNMNVWSICRENVDRVIKLCLRAFHDSYSAVSSAEIIPLLDYVAFEIRTTDKK